MEDQHILFGVFLVLALVFISTFGSLYTGNVVYTGDKITLANYPYPFIKNNNYNSLYIVLPNSYTLDEFEAANNVLNGIKLSDVIEPKIVTVSDLPQGEHNLILVGDSCTNSLISYYTQSKDCSLGLKSGEGLLQLFNNDRSSVLVVSGYDLESIKKASKVLSLYHAYPLRNKKVIVSGNSESIYGYVLRF
ncbi:hypothetical protein J4476_01880 [Candidatus Woesearchaeota archaeon]|nr:MAG: hypothetical protein QT09_C0016G0017 [archaeon GW2011_AR18]MBS3161424.1 hypothetical protein [Candidatus Woesearchaeota archaeon]HIH25867.1 hypothetical protein [Nanoarchaeota archaeon]